MDDGERSIEDLLIYRNVNIICTGKLMYLVPSTTGRCKILFPNIFIPEYLICIHIPVHIHIENLFSSFHLMLSEYNHLLCKMLCIYVFTYTRYIHTGIFFLMLSDNHLFCIMLCKEEV